VICAQCPVPTRPNLKDRAIRYPFAARPRAWPGMYAQPILDLEAARG
jgi:hypothetical protein